MPRNQFEHGVITRAKVAVPKLHLAETVVFVRVGARNPECEVRAESLECERQSSFKVLQIVRATYMPRQFHIERTSRLLRRIVASNMDRIREYALIAREDAIASVALMGVRVDNKNSPVWMNRMQVSNGDGDIVEDAVTESAIRESMMRASGEVAR